MCGVYLPAIWKKTNSFWWYTVFTLCFMCYILLKSQYSMFMEQKAVERMLFIVSVLLSFPLVFIMSALKLWDHKEGLWICTLIYICVWCTSTSCFQMEHNTLQNPVRPKKKNKETKTKLFYRFTSSKCETVIVESDELLFCKTTKCDMIQGFRQCCFYV